MPATDTVWSAFDLGDTAGLRARLRAGADPNEPLFAGGDPPLHAAVERGWLAGARALIAAGAVVNARSSRGDTALMWACINRTDARLGLIAALLKVGADLETTNALGMTPLVYMTRLGAGCQDSMTMTSESDGVVTTVEITAEEIRASYLDVIRLLVKSGANLDARDGAGRTALDIALDAGNEAFAGVLRRQPEPSIKRRRRR